MSDCIHFKAYEAVKLISHSVDVDGVERVEVGEWCGHDHGSIEACIPCLQRLDTNKVMDGNDRIVTVDWKQIYKKVSE